MIYNHLHRLFTMVESLATPGGEAWVSFWKARQTSAAADMQNEIKIG